MDNEFDRLLVYLGFTAEQYYEASGLNKFKKQSQELQDALGAAVQKGLVVSKSQLVDGGVYIGDHRIARVAMWDAKNNEFVYARYKFGSTFGDTAKHPEDDDGFSLFVPMKKIGPDSPYWDNDEVEVMNKYRQPRN